MRGRIRRQCYYDARVADVNLEEITSSMHNANILRALRDDNYRDEIGLYSSEEGIEDEDADFVLRDGDDLGWVGYFIGKSKYLETLAIISLPEAEERERIDELMEGVTRNKSITQLLIGPGLGDAGYQELGRLFRENRNLSTLAFLLFDIGRQQAQSIASLPRQMQRNQIKKICFMHNNISEEGLEEICQFLRSQPQIELLDLQGSNIGRNGCVEFGSMLNSWHAPNLEELQLDDSAIDDRGLQALVQGMANCSNLEIVKLSGNDSITAAGLRSLSILFKRENCPLRELWLQRMNIGDDGAATLAEGLLGNKSLQKLYFDRDSSGITQVGWSAFSKLLCDTSSINNTYLSNHTLKWIGASEFGGVSIGMSIPVEVGMNLCVNATSDKRDVAALKILRYHREYDVEHFFQWKLMFLPLVVTWFERARPLLDRLTAVLIASGDYLSLIIKMNKVKLTSVYKFVRGMPMLVVDGYQSQVPLRRSKRRKLLNGEAR